MPYNSEAYNQLFTISLPEYLRHFKCKCLLIFPLFTIGNSAIVFAQVWTPRITHQLLSLYHVSCPIHQKITWVILPEYIYNLTTSYHLHSYLQSKPPLSHPCIILIFLWMFFLFASTLVLLLNVSIAKKMLSTYVKSDHSSAQNIPKSSHLTQSMTQILFNGLKTTGI